MINEERNANVSDDLTTNANADEVTSDLRDSSLINLTKYNVDEKFITAKFASLDDAKRAYEALTKHGYPRESIVLAIPGETEDQFFNSFDALVTEFTKGDKHYRYVSMGLESLSPEQTVYVSSVWDAHNAVTING